MFALLLAAILAGYGAVAVHAEDTPSGGAAIEHGFGSAPPPGSDATIDELVAYAAANNPGLKAAYYRWKAASEGRPAASALPDPVFTWGYFIENIETRLGPQEQRFGLRQTIPWFGTLGSKGNIAAEDANAAYQDFLDAKLVLVHAVKSAFYDLYLLEREIEIALAAAELLRYWERIARNNYETSLRGYHDIIKAQIELSIHEDRLFTLEERKSPLEARLRRALNLPDSVPVPAVPDTIVVPTAKIDPLSVKRKIIERNPDLKSLGHLVKRDEAAVRLAKKAAYPGITLGVDYIMIGDAINPSVEQSGKDAWIFTAGVNIPLWFRKSGAKRNQARARLSMSRHTLGNRTNELLAAADEICFAHNDASRKIDLYRDVLIPKTESALSAAFAAYRGGEAEFLNVIDTQRQLLEFRLGLERGLVRRAKILSEIDILTGNEFQQ